MSLFTIHNCHKHEDNDSSILNFTMYVILMEIDTYTKLITSTLNMIRITHSEVDCR